MQEYVSEAVVLNKEPLRDFDARYALFTKRFGRVVGKATSTRKITSKLAGHLEPGTLTHIRFIERNGGGNGTQIIDALKRSTLGISLADLGFLNRILSEREPDEMLWEEITGGRFSWWNALKILGWDPRGAKCAHCGRAVTHFYLPRQEFFCAACASKSAPGEVLLLGNAEL